MLLKHLAGHAAFINMYHRSEHFYYKSIFKAVIKMFAPQKRMKKADNPNYTSYAERCKTVLHFPLYSPISDNIEE